MERRTIQVSGIVQGVGFRPFVHGLAVRHRLAGFVRNDIGSVMIEVEGESQALDLFLSELAEKPPPLAHIENICWQRQPPRGDRSFRIEASKTDGAEQV